MCCRLGQVSGRVIFCSGGHRPHPDAPRSCGRLSILHPSRIHPDRSLDGPTAYSEFARTRAAALYSVNNQGCFPFLLGVRVPLFLHPWRTSETAGERKRLHADGSAASSAKDGTRLRSVGVSGARKAAFLFRHHVNAGEARQPAVDDGEWSIDAHRAFLLFCLAYAHTCSQTPRNREPFPMGNPSEQGPGFLQAIALGFKNK